MKKLLFLLLLLVPPSVYAQVVIGPTSVLAWGQEESSLANVQGGTFTLFYGLSNKVVLTNVSCSGVASPYDCSARPPSLPPGNYSLQLVFSRNINGVMVTSPPSVTLLITVPVPPIPPTLKAPINFRITNDE